MINDYKSFLDFLKNFACKKQDKSQNDVKFHDPDNLGCLCVTMIKPKSFFNEN